ncbi:MAG: iron uptake porin [Symploca sp. SIO3C6]|nr:iron uptake porin [Symploca sp. SIO3C6]
MNKFSQTKSDQFVSINAYLWQGITLPKNAQRAVREALKAIAIPLNHFSPALVSTFLLLFAHGSYAAQNNNQQQTKEVRSFSPLTELPQTVAEKSSIPHLPSASSAPGNSRNLPKINLVSDARQVLEQIQLYNGNSANNSLNQITNVSQLRDVSPGDWAYEALRSLVERYGCIAGYPNGTYQGNRPLSRYEFAAGLNACLQQIERLIAGNTESFSGNDLETLQRLTQEFETELTTLGARVDNLEGRVAFLEDHQFSTTTKLKGQAVFNIAGAFGDEKALAGEDDLETSGLDDNIVFNNRVRLAFVTSFTGKDQLTTRLEAGNFDNFAQAATGTDMARLGYEASGGNDVKLERLHYQFPVGDKLQFHLGAFGVTFDDIANPINPFFESNGNGALTRFGQRNPALYRSGEQAIGANIKLTDSISLDLAYLSGEAASPEDKDGLFNGDYNAAAQLNFALGENLDLALSYARYFAPGEDVNLSGNTGSTLAKTPFGAVATSANRFGAQASWRINSKLNLAGWVGYIDASAESGAREGDHADIWNWAMNLAVLDVGKEGSVLGLIVGMPPKATNVDGGPEDEDTSWLVEAHYRYPLTDNIQITPGAYVIFNPNHSDRNDPIYVGVLRTTFSF